MKKIIYYTTLCLLLNSCASYINRVHGQIKRGERKGQMRKRPRAPRGADNGYNPFSRKRFDKRPIQNPVTFNNSTPQRQTRAKNRYGNQRKRISADDLVDQGSNGSLWAGKDKENYLFSDNKTKTLGDMIIIDVLEGLRNDIANELKRAFPTVIRKKVAKKDDKKPGAAAEEAPTAAASKPEDPNDTKIYDKISGQVVEIISKDYILVRGRKEVLFRKQKRLVDVQALVSKKDLTNDDTIISDKILEQKITILR